MRGLWLGVLGVLVACGSSAANQASVEFTPKDNLAFDDAVDVIDRPVIVESEWQGQFERRVTHADFIGSVRVESISVDQDRRGAGYRLVARVVETLLGRAPRELALEVHDDQPGFESVRMYEDDLLGGRFIVFVKWQAQADSREVLPRWHLSPDSPGVRDKVRFFLNPGASDGRTEVEVLAP
ncbi:MAG: hypothetical protein AAF500_11975 [Myxococcota bacterium]